MTNYWFDWSNTLRDRPYDLDEVGRFAAAQPKGAFLSDYVLFDEEGYANAQRLTEFSSIPLYVYVHLLHSAHPRGQFGMREGNAFRYERMQLFENLYAVDDQDTPSVIWTVPWAQSYYDHYFHVDPRTTRALDYVNLVVKYLMRFPVTGIFVDYFSATPWWYRDLNSSGPHHEADYIPAYHAYQMEFLANLRHQMPDLEIVTNGRWPIDNPWLFKQADKINLERAGSHWYNMDRALDLIRRAADEHPDVGFVIDTRRGPNMTQAERDFMGEIVPRLYDDTGRAVWNL